MAPAVGLTGAAGASGASVVAGSCDAIGSAVGADALSSTGADSTGAATFFAAAFFAGAGAFAAASFNSGNLSCKRRITGASTVDDADLTYSPTSSSFEMMSLLSTPSAFASSYTRTLDTILQSGPRSN